MAQTFCSTPNPDRNLAETAGWFSCCETLHASHGSKGLDLDLPWGWLPSFILGIPVKYFGIVCTVLFFFYETWFPCFLHPSCIWRGKDFLENVLAVWKYGVFSGFWPLISLPFSHTAKASRTAQKTYTCNSSQRFCTVYLFHLLSVTGSAMAAAALEIMISSRQNIMSGQPIPRGGCDWSSDKMVAGWEEFVLRWAGKPAGFSGDVEGLCPEHGVFCWQCCSNGA